MYCRLSQQKQFSNRLFNRILKDSNLNKDDFTHLKAYNFQRNSKSHNRLLLWHNRGFNWSMSGKIKNCCLLHEEKTWTRSRVLQNLNFWSSKHRKEAQSIKRKTTLLHFHHSPSSLLSFNGIDSQTFTTHLHNNVFERGCKAISGNFARFPETASHPGANIL